jgi:NhaP-type Na+/H+ or K+/H+ antiporter
MAAVDTAAALITVTTVVVVFSILVQGLTLSRLLKVKGHGA